MEEKDNMAIWQAVKQPPREALKTIAGGRLTGMTDINPQWRYEILTQQFGPCGTGWGYEIKRLWLEQAADGQVFAFAEVALWYKQGDKRSEPIPGIGGSMLIAKESKGLYASDEAYKMAVTDALSVACKMLGVGADVYAGRWDGSKYSEPEGSISKAQAKQINKAIEELCIDKEKFLGYLGVGSVKEITDYKKAIAAINAKKKTMATPEQKNEIRKLAKGFPKEDVEKQLKCMTKEDADIFIAHLKKEEGKAL